MSHENLSRRAILAGAASVPALASGATCVSACTLPPDLIEQFVRVRAWYLRFAQASSLYGDEIDRRFYAATGVTSEQYRDLDCDHPRFEELKAAREKVFAEVRTPLELDDTESDRLCDERWRVAEAIIDHKPQTVVDLAWQAEAYLLADLDLFTFAPDSENTSDRLTRTLFRHIRLFGAVPQPDDPLGLLSI